MDVFQHPSPAQLMGTHLLMGTLGTPSSPPNADAHRQAKPTQAQKALMLLHTRGSQNLSDGITKMYNHQFLSPQ